MPQQPNAHKQDNPNNTHQSGALLKPIQWPAALHFTGWRRTVYVLYFVQFIAVLGFAIIFPFLPLYVESLGAREGSVEFWSGMVFSAQAFTMMLASPMWGALADRYGRKMMVQRATFGGAITMFLMAFVTSAEELVLLRAIQGVVTGVMAAANALVVSVAPREKVGAVVGGLEMSRWLGISLGPVIGGILADAYGYGAPFIATAALLAVGGVLTQLFVEEHFVPPEDKSGQDKRGNGIFRAWRHILTAPGVAVTYGLRLLVSMGQTTLAPILALLMASLLTADSGHIATVTGLTTSVASLAGTISAVYLGRLGDRVGYRRVLIYAALVGGLAYFPQALATEVWQLLVLQAISGAAAGGLGPMLSALLARYTRPGQEGAVYGLDNSVIATGRTIAPLLGGAIAAISLRLPFLLTGLIFLVVGGAAFALPTVSKLETESGDSG